MQDWFIDLLKLYEGFRSKAYWDVDHYSIGYGSDTMPDGSPVKANSTITEQEAAKLIPDYINKKEKYIKKYFPNYDSLPELTRYALIDQLYRGGQGAFAKSPKFTKALQDAYADGKLTLEEADSIIKELDIDHSKGGVKDRKLRRAAMLLGVYNPEHNSSVYSKSSPYANFHLEYNNPLTVWGLNVRHKVLPKWDLVSLVKELPNYLEFFLDGGVASNRSYGLRIKENVQGMWEKIKTNPFANMVFPFEEVSEGNTMAIIPYIVPGGGAVKLTVKIAKELPVTERLFKLGASNVKNFRLARKLNRSIDATKLTPTEIDQAVLSGKVGWAPSLDITWRHGSDNPTLREFVPYNRWDVLNRGASPYEYFVTRQGSPTNMMDSRPYLYTGMLRLEKPMVLLNEFNIAGLKNVTRNQLLSQSRSRGADAYILENISDNKAKNLDVVVRFIDSKGESISPQLSGQTTSVGSTGNTSFAFFERPSKLSFGERAGIPKGDRFYQDPEILKNAKQFAEKYGYDVPSTIEEAKLMYRLHNSFFRTTLAPEDVIASIQESDPKLAEVLKGLSREELVKLLASKGYPSAFRGIDISEYPGFADDFVFVSPSVEANLPYIEAAGNNSTTVLLRRPFSFNNPKTWHIDADWRPVAADQLIEYPRAKGIVQMGNVSPKQELKISTDHLIPVKLAVGNDKGTNLGTYLSVGNKKHGGTLNYLDFFKK